MSQKLSPQKRRKEISTLLEKSAQPITGSDLADKFSVSRQVIVQDIALLRAEGYEILATSRGYLIPENSSSSIRCTLACQHDGENVKEELQTIINHGARILDVIVEHPLYGELRGMLMLQSSEDIDKFMEKMQKNEATLLSSLTDGVHLHTIEVMNENVYNRLKATLNKKGFLVEG